MTGSRTGGYTKNETSVSAFELDVEGVRKKKVLQVKATLIQLREKKLF